MTEKQTIRASRYMSLVLRHSPDTAGLQLDEAGWVPVADLLRGINQKRGPFTLEQLKHVVATNDKKRFEFNADETKIRASQGHSVNVDLQYEVKKPPKFLYHGTAQQFVERVKIEGLKKMRRHHVHLSEEKVMTMKVGARRGNPVLVIIRAEEMHEAGHLFYETTNGVWLTDEVPSEYLEIN